MDLILNGSALEEEAFFEISKIIRTPMILNLLNQIEKYDSYTFKHSVAVTEKSYELGINAKLSKNNMLDLSIAALLHDIGKIFIDKNILNKKGRLTDIEYQIMKTHASLGADYIKQTNCFSEKIIKGIKYHHEDYNGTGYYGLKGNNIPYIARIIRIADTFSAMTDNRCYHTGKLANVVLKEMKEFESLDKNLLQIANETYRTNR